MAWIFGDSFDFYAASADALLGHWDGGAITNYQLSTPANARFGVGQALNIFSVNATGINKASGSNDATHHVVFAYRNNATASNSTCLSITLYDGATAQCSINFNPFLGNITLTSGLSSGTVLATYAANLASGIWYGLEFEVTINNTTGSFKVRVNGNTADDFSATGLNTRGGTANNYANKIAILAPNGPNNTLSVDDFLWFNTSGAAPNTWVGDIRAEQKMPNGVAATSGMTVSPSTQDLGDGVSQVTNTALTSTNKVAFSPVMSLGVSGSITGITFTFGTAFTGHYKLGIYDGTAGTPGSLLAQTAEQTNAIVGVVTVSLITPLAVTPTTKFFVACLADAAMTGVTLSQSANVIPNSLTQTYASGFPANAGNPSIQAAFTTGVHGRVTIAPDTSYGVSQAITDGDTSFVYSATVGANDLYTIPALSSTPLSVVAVQTRMQVRKSDTALRQARIQVKSGATTSNGGTVTLSSSYVYTSKVDTVDPNTAAAWTGAAVNSMQIGEYVVA